MHLFTLALLSAVALASAAPSPAVAHRYPFYSNSRRGPRNELEGGKDKSVDGKSVDSDDSGDVVTTGFGFGELNKRSHECCERAHVMFGLVPSVRGTV